MKPSSRIAQQLAPLSNDAQVGATVRPFRPRTFNKRTQTRFISRRRLFWLARCSGEPTVRQAALALSIAQLEWSIAVAEHEGTTSALRDLREAIRLKDRLLDTYLKSHAVPPARRPGAALDEHLRRVAQREAEAA